MEMNTDAPVAAGTRKPWVDPAMEHVLTADVAAALSCGGGTDGFGCGSVI